MSVLLVMETAVTYASTDQDIIIVNDIIMTSYTITCYKLGTINSAASSGTDLTLLYYILPITVAISKDCI